MSAWDAYPVHYREKEVRAILAAIRAGECVSIVGLSGAGKSNLMGFLFYRCSTETPVFVLFDGNRAQPRTAEGLFRLAAQSVLSESAPETGPAERALEKAVAARMKSLPSGLCLLFDRYDALDSAERAATTGPLRALRDAYKYQLTYVIATRRPLDPADELAELFYANTIWLGPLSGEDARWSAQQYAARRGQSWMPDEIEQIIDISWGYPALLRACCEAYAAGAPLEEDALRAHPAVQRRVQEFWADAPSAEDVSRAGLHNHPLLRAAQPAVSAESPDLTANEHRLLAYFQAHPDEVCPKDALIQAVWPEDKVVDGLRDDSLAQLIRRLRVKIGAERIQTIPGRGYQYRTSTAIG